VALARRPLFRARLNRHLLLQRASSPLFNVELWVAHFEAAIRMALESESTSSSLGAMGSKGVRGGGGNGVGRMMDIVVARAIHHSSTT